MAGYAAALKVLTSYSNIDCKDMVVKQKTAIEVGGKLYIVLFLMVKTSKCLRRKSPKANVLKRRRQLPNRRCFKHTKASPLVDVSDIRLTEG